jgi:hypothetical protein
MAIGPAGSAQEAITKGLIPCSAQPHVVVAAAPAAAPAAAAAAAAPEASCYQLFTTAHPQQQCGLIGMAAAAAQLLSKTAGGITPMHKT